MALGARGVDLRRLMMAGGVRLIVAGVVVGLGGAVALGRLVASMLFGVSATDGGDVRGDDGGARRRCDARVHAARYASEPD